MRHQDYVDARARRDPKFAAHRAVASAELAFSELVAERREARKLARTDVAQITGIAEARLAALEEGDSMSLNELLWLCHALDIQLWIDCHFHVRLGPTSLVDDPVTPEAATVGTALDVLVVDRSR